MAGILFHVGDPAIWAGDTNLLVGGTPTASSFYDGSTTPGLPSMVEVRFGRR